MRGLNNIIMKPSPPSDGGLRNALPLPYKYKSYTTGCPVVYNYNRNRFLKNHKRDKYIQTEY